ncbi:hypothetical protein Hanom_Chr12g01154211 [Helianthus anomalus]
MLTLSVKIQNPFDHVIQLGEKTFSLHFFSCYPNHYPQKVCFFNGSLKPSYSADYFEDHTQMRWVKWVNTSAFCFLFFYGFNVQ